MTTQPKPSAGAMRAAEAIAKWNNSGASVQHADTIRKGDLPSLAQIIDRETAHAELLAALNAYTTALAAFAIEQPDMKVGEVLDYLAKRDVPAKAIAAIAKAEGR